MQYGSIIRVVTPTGRVTQAQVGDMTPEGPMLHINSSMVEAPAEVLRAEGWEIPDMPEEVTAPAGYAAEAKEIVDALLSDEEMEIAKSAAASGPRQLGNSNRAVGRTLHRSQMKKTRCTNCGSPAHVIDDCPVLGNAIV